MSSEDGFLILKKMRDEHSRLWVVFVERDKTEHFDSRVSDVTDDGKLVLSKYEVADFVVDLDGVGFRYADPRESADPERIRESFDSCLALSWPNGARCRLFVIRDSESVTVSSKR